MLFVLANGEERPVRLLESPLVVKEKLLAEEKDPIFFLVNMKNKILGEVEHVQVRYRLAGLPEVLERSLPLKHFEKARAFVERGNGAPSDLFPIETTPMFFTLLTALKEIGSMASSPAAFSISLSTGADVEREIGPDELPSLLIIRSVPAVINIRETGSSDETRSSQESARDSSLEQAREEVGRRPKPRSASAMERPLTLRLPMPTLAEVETPKASPTVDTPQAGDTTIRLRLEIVEGDPVKEMLISSGDKVQAIIVRALTEFELDTADNWKRYNVFLFYKEKERILRSLESPSAVQKKLSEGDETPVFILRSTRDDAKKKKGPEFLLSPISTAALTLSGKDLPPRSPLTPTSDGSSEGKELKLVGPSQLFFIFFIFILFFNE